MCEEHGDAAGFEYTTNISYFINFLKTDFMKKIFALALSAMMLGGGKCFCTNAVHGAGRLDFQAEECGFQR